ncbi:MAG: DUF1549 domain-containing protein [Prosthecobacter sp.]|jgi:hypothetical protein|uniref:DUF1549 domain-containing protein n=1 Tax=Prosthecobacter sp. TaxID=1965333 RepID=UPI0019DD03A4|nr:DUF1549 domain-containing protein [Prosthecobacter sp.]MBE2286088.1 DUF1549 domain-containing protein [Prosthecobacter sp.]
MKQTTKLLSSLTVLALFAGSALAESRTWTDVQGRQVTATFVGLEGDNITLQTADGTMHRFPLANLSAEDQALAKKLVAEAPAAPAAAEGQPAYLANATVGKAAAVIDGLVARGLVRANPERMKTGKKPITNFNAPCNDEQFVRRVYLDIVGRIPNHEETTAFLANSAADKRAKLIDMLLDSPGYNSHMYNYVAEMLRVKDDFGGGNNVRGLPYINWLQQQVEKNVGWDKMVYSMLTATGKMWDKKADGTYNGEAGYLLRDTGMPLDNLANTLAVFLGTDVACAQCHDHPFSDWTQHQFFELASFFGASTTRYQPRRQKSRTKDGMAMTNMADKLMPEVEGLIEKGGGDLTRIRNGLRQFIGANNYAITDLAENSTKLPHDYKYPDAKPGDFVAPKFISWSKDDKNLAAYKQKTKVEEDLRVSFATWATHPTNPRFAMAIANRMWKRAFGQGISEPVTNIDDPNQSVNPELLKHLAEEMKRVKFSLKDFMRILYNTRAYQSEATTEFIAMGEPYYFQGPLLRRMTAEQAWDSYMTLVLGDPDKYKKPLEDLYSKSIDLDLYNPKLDAKTILIKYDAYRRMAAKESAMMGGGLADAGGDMMMEGSKGKSKGDAAPAGEMMENASLKYGNLVLRRAAELEQPARPGHFLTDFGQSPRNLIDGSNKIGSVPQVLMMMNGQAQEMLTNQDSLIFRTMEKVKSPSEKVEALFLSVLSRRPTLVEKDIAKRALSSGDDGYANMIWALINTREFIFVQ